MNIKRGINMEEKQEENLFSKEEWDSLIREEKCEGDFPQYKWHPVAKEVKEQEALQKPDFYNKILLVRSGR